MEVYQERNVFTISTFLSQCTKDYYMNMLGPNSFKKAIEEAEKLSESLKLRLEASIVLNRTQFNIYCKIKHLNQCMQYCLDSSLTCLIFTF